MSPETEKATTSVIGLLQAIRLFKSATSYIVDPGIVKILDKENDDDLARSILRRTSQGGRQLLQTRNISEQIIQELPLVFSRQSVNLSCFRYETRCLFDRSLRQNAR